MLFNAFIVAFLLFILSTNIFGKRMTDKGTMISSAIVAGVGALFTVICPENMRETAMTIFAGIAVVAGISQFFK